MYQLSVLLLDELQSISVAWRQQVFHRFQIISLSVLYIYTSICRLIHLLILRFLYLVLCEVFQSF